MFSRNMLFLTGLALTALPAAAAPLSKDYLDKAYESCVGNDGTASAAKKAYCACSRDGLASLFDNDSYLAFSEKAAAGAPPEDGMTKLRALANACIAKTLK